MKTIGYLLFDGFSGLELMFPAFVLRKQKIQTIGLHKGPIIGEENIHFYPDITLMDLNESNLDALILPGGSAIQHLEEGSLLQKKLEIIHQKSILIAAICGSPVLLANTSILKGKKFTAGYSGDLPEHWQKNFKQGEYLGKEDVVIDGNIITAKGIAVVKFAIAIGKELDIFQNQEEEQNTYNMLQKIR